MQELFFGDDIKIEVFDNSTRITLKDGSTVLGIAEDTDEYRETAKLNGYGKDTTKLCIEHEIMHVALAWLLKVDSPTLDFVGRNIPRELWLRQMEEDAVLAIQRYTRALGIDLVTVFS